MESKNSTEFGSGWLYTEGNTHDPIELKKISDIECEPVEEKTNDSDSLCITTTILRP